MTGGLRGFVGQRMNGQKSSGSEAVKYFDKSAGSGSITAPDYPVQCEVWLWAGGASGLSASNKGGGGGGAVYDRFTLGASQSLTYTVAASVGSQNLDGNDSTVTLPTGRVIRATGGKSPSNGGEGGSGSGGKLHRRGGRGAASAASSGEAGENGGTGGGAGGGGGGAGFSDYGDLPGGTGGSTPTVPGGGGNASSGAAGRLVVVMTRILS